MAGDTLRRKVQFYRLRAIEPGTGLPSQGWAEHLGAIAAHGRAGTAHHRSPDGMVLLGRVVEAADAEAMALYVVRYDDLPARERDGRISDLRLRRDEGLAEPIHVVFHPRNVVGLLYNHYGPRVNRLAEYLNVMCRMAVDVEPLVRRDVLAVLERLTSLRRVHVRFGEHHLEDLRADESLYEAVADVHGLGGGTLELGWRFEPDRREVATREWKARLRRILDGAGRGAVERAEVRGDDPESGRVETLDLLSDRIVVERQVERARDRARLVDDDSAVAAIREAYRLAEEEIRASVAAGGTS